MATSDAIRILLADDSPTVRHYLATLIHEMPGMRVVGEARDGAEAVRLVSELKPDVVSMDINMPQVDGLEATRRIMMQSPTPVVVVSGMLDVDVDLSLKALEAGALAVVGKPPDRHHPTFNRRRRQMITTLRAMAAVKVVARRVYPPIGDEGISDDTLLIRPEQVAKPNIIAIGASTGGPSALHRLLEAMPPDLPVPIVVAQHMPDEFIGGLCRWLDDASALTVVLAEDKMPLDAGTVYLAPGSSHLIVNKRGESLIARIMAHRGQSRYQPSVDVLFESVALACENAAIGVVLTGMGDDGAKGLKAMRLAGAHTFAQDEASCIVFGMPRAAIMNDAVQHIEPLANLPLKLTKLL